MRAIDHAPSLRGPCHARCFDRGHGPVAAHWGADEKRTNDARVIITRASNVLWRRGEISNRGDRVPRLLTWGLPVSRSVRSTTSAQGATRVGEHFIGRDSVSDGQRPILRLAASCDRVNRCRNLGACFRAQGATRGKLLQGPGTTWRSGAARHDVETIYTTPARADVSRGTVFDSASQSARARGLTVRSMASSHVWCSPRWFSS